MAISRLLAAQGWVQHTRDVQAAVARLNTVVSRAARTRTEYVSNGNPADLEKYQQALAHVDPQLAALKSLTRDNAAHQSSIAQLEKLLDQRIRLMQESVALQQSGRSTLQNQADITRSIISVAAQMDVLTQTIQDQEQELLQMREGREQKWEIRAAVLLSLSFLAAILLLVMHYRLLTRELEGRLRAETSLRRLSARILQIQDEERRKFSRELHDSLGQYLAGAKMNLDLLSGSMPQASLLTDSIRILDAALAETRTISHLLHPPLLDETGFASAARWYVEGFSKRSGIHISLEIPEPFERLTPPVELAMFRVLQEGLTNIHRHAHGTKAEVKVVQSHGHVCLTVRDNGRGIPPSVLERFQSDGVNSGVGLAGMRERLRELGGQFEISSDRTGTKVAAMLPRSVLPVPMAELTAAD